MRTSITITRMVEDKEDAFKCDRCGAIVASPLQDARPDGWLLMKNAAPSAAIEDYCSEECAAQTLAARVGKLLA